MKSPFNLFFFLVSFRWNCLFATEFRRQFYLSFRGFVFKPFMIFLCNFWFFISFFGMSCDASV